MLHLQSDSFCCSYSCQQLVWLVAFCDPFWTPPPVGKWVEQLSLSDLNYTIFLLYFFYISHLLYHMGCPVNSLGCFVVRVTVNGSYVTTIT